MKQISHVNAATLDEAVAALDAKAAVIAGGTDIYNALKGMIYGTPPAKLVNIKTIPGLSYIKEEGGMLKVGALTTLTEIADSSVVQGKWSILAQAAKAVGTPQLRNMGTLGGNLCQDVRCWYYRAEHNEFNCLRKGGSLCYMVGGNAVQHSAIFGQSGCFAGSVSDTATALAALDATIVTTKRSLPIKDFFLALGNALADNEIVKEVQVPTPKAGTKQTFLRYAERKALDFAEVSVAAVLVVEGGNVSDSRIILGGVSAVPYRATGAENALKGKPANQANAEAAGAEAVKGATPVGVANKMDNKYKVQMAKVLVKRAILS